MCKWIKRREQINVLPESCFLYWTSLYTCIWELAFSIPWVIFQNRVLHFIPDIFCSSLLILPSHNPFIVPSVLKLTFHWAMFSWGTLPKQYTLLFMHIMSWPPLDFTENILSWDYTVCVYIHYMLTF